MGKIRIYELAKELGVDNRAVIQMAQDLGMPGKSSHSNSLEADEAEQLRRTFIRAAIGSSPDSQVVRTQVDTTTGQTKTIIESRKGNIVRRRRQVAEEDEGEETYARSDEEPIPAEEAGPLTESEIEEMPISTGHNGAPADVVLEESEEPVEETRSEPQEAGAGPLEAAPPAAAEGVEAVEPEPGKEAKKPAIGPKVLGKIELPRKKVKVEKERRPGAAAPAVVPVVTEEEEEEGEEGAGKGRKAAPKRRSRKREFTRGQLVDYEGRPGRRRGVRDGAGRAGREDGAGDGDDLAREAQPQRASKRVIKMASDVITVGELARQMSLKAGEVIAKLMELGVMVTINQAVDTDTATIVAEEFDYTIEFTGFDEGEALNLQQEDQPGVLEPRPPVVTVMGHVDHGKTSLLDKIRSTSVAAREHGGITQHIGAYRVALPDGRSVVFIDTPGHEAFTQMRARGAEVTDIVIVLVAADDGVMPQTIEAINHAKAANVSMIVAINKIDKPDANPDRVKQQLAERGLQPEEWGGDVMMFPVSAITGAGIDALLEGILLLAEMKELKADSQGKARGAIVEARQERGLGTVATALVQSGRLRVGDIFVCGAEYGRVRSMYDDNQRRMEEAGPSTPVEITGLNGVPLAGDDFIVVAGESVAKQVAENRKQRRAAKDALSLAGGPISLEEFSRRASEEQAAELNIIIKADVHGTLEAVRDSVEKLSTSKVKVRVLHGAVGGVTESDVQLAIASHAIIVGFGVRAEPRTLQEAENAGVEVRFYRIIYELIDDVRKAMTGLLEPIRQEVPLARAEVRDTFTIPKIGTIAGCYVLDGTVKRGARLRLLRDSKVVHEGKMGSLRRFKDDVREVQSGYECGISFSGYNDIKLGDVIEVFEIREVAPTLE